MISLASWTLDYGAGATPSSWTVFASGTQAVSNATLGTWATLALSNGLYTVRLSASDTQGDLIQVTVGPSLGNFTMTQSTMQFNPSASQTLTYTSIVPFALTETKVLKNSASQTVRTLVNAVSRTANSYNDIWNGKNDATVLLTGGPYFYSATVTDGTHTMTWDLTSKNVDTYFQTLYPTITAFDPFSNNPMSFSYNFSQPGRVTLAFSPPGTFWGDCNPPRFCILDAKYEESGSHTITWAGADPTGAYRGDIAQLALVTDRKAFSANAVVVFGTKPTVSNVRATPPFYSPAAGSQTVEFDLATYQSQAASITITFLNQTSLSVLRTLTLSNQAPGHVTRTWDGKADNGMAVAPGLYTITVAATDGLGNQVKGQILTTLAY